MHRDLRPANIQVATEGSAAGQVKVLDFGLAKSYEGEGASSEMRRAARNSLRAASS